LSKAVSHIVVALLLCFILTFRCGTCMSGEPAQDLSSKVKWPRSLTDKCVSYFLSWHQSAET